MTSVNVAVVGMGKMGLLHSCIFNGLDEGNVVAVCENDKLMSNILSKYLRNINVYRDFNKMLETEEIDGLVITTPVFLHKPMIESGFNEDINLFVEKPLALDGTECRSIINTVKTSKKCISMVGYCRRFMDTFKLADEIIKSETLGKPIYFNSQLFVSQVFKPGKGWIYDPKSSGGGVLADLGSHAFDMFSFLFGDIYSVHGFSKAEYNLQVEDYAVINLKFKNDLIGSLQISWSMRNYRLPELKIKVILEKGDIIVTEKYIDIWSESENEMLKKGSNVFYKQDLTKNVPINIGGPEYTLEDRHFLQCIKDGTSTSCSFEEAAKANFVIDAIYSSIKSGEAEKVRYEV